MAGEAPLVYKDANGDELVVASGGIINIKTGGKLQNDGVDMNLSSGIATATSSSTAELNTLHSVTAGTAAASKAVVLDASKDVTGLHKIGFTQEAEHASVNRTTKSVNTTLDASYSGQIVDVDTDAVVITLPATVVGMCFEIRNAAADGAALISLAPNAADKIQGCGLTAADNKASLNTKATAKKGDSLKVIGDGVDGWFIVHMRGTWARAA